MSNVKRVLFVDDDRNVLTAMRRLFKLQRVPWESVFAEGPFAALEALASTPFDVVVTDMRMPGMSGDELLARIREQYPCTVRVILSGTADSFDGAVAHHFLTKPCDNVALTAIVDADRR
jgi:DNA-binding NtrC family response regulator